MKPTSRPLAVRRIWIAVPIACVLSVTMASAGNAARRPGSTDPSRTGPGGLESQLPDTDPVARGKYLTGVGGCMACHTAPGGEPSAAPRHDGGIRAWFAPNPATGLRDGIGKYSIDRLVAYLKTGQAPGMGAVPGPATKAIHDNLRQMNDADLHAIAAYVKSISP